MLGGGEGDVEGWWGCGEEKGRRGKGGKGGESTRYSKSIFFPNPATSGSIVTEFPSIRVTLVLTTLPFFSNLSYGISIYFCQKNIEKRRRKEVN